MDELKKVVANAIWSWVCPNGGCQHENTIEESFEEEMITECELCGEQVKVVKE